MTTILVAFCLSLVLGIIFTRIMVTVAVRLGVVDKPDGYRKLHIMATPLMGGVAVYLAFLAPLLLLYLHPWSLTTRLVRLHGRDLLVLMMCSGMTLILGAVDDIFNIRARWKFIGQVLIASAAFMLGLRVEAIINPFGGGGLVLGVFSYPVTMLWFLGCMNAVNLMDGMDGLAAGSSLFVSLTLFFMCLLFHSTWGVLLMGCLSGAILGFLVFNFPPARIFLGDSGSLLLGFLIASLSVIGGIRKADAAVALFIPVVALGLPIIDTSLAILRRWYHRFPISAPDRKHIHHVLISKGFSQRKIVLSLYAATVVLGMIALGTVLGRSEIVLFIIGSLVAVVYVCIRVFTGLHLRDLIKKLVDDQERKERSTQVRIAMNRATSLMRKAETLEEAWRVCGEVFALLDLEYAELTLDRKDCGSHSEFRWKAEDGKARGPYDLPMDGWLVRMGILTIDGVKGSLVAGKNDAREVMFSEIPEILDGLRAEMGEQIGRLER